MISPFSWFIRSLHSLFSPTRPRPPRVYRPSLDQGSHTVADIICDLADTCGEPFRAVVDKIEMIAGPGESPQHIQSTWAAHKSEKEAAESRDKAEQANHRLEARNRALKNAPKKMTFGDRAAWDYQCERAKGTPVASTLAYAQEWARIMEGSIADGNTIESCAEKTSFLASDVGGNEFHIAVRVLIDTWAHGEELRRWYEKRYAYRTGG